MAISFGIPTALSIAGTLTISSLSSGMLKVTAGVVSVGSAGTDYVLPGAVTTSGLTMATARLLGRTTASTGAIEEITVTSNLTLSAGSLTVASTLTSINSITSAALSALTLGTGTFGTSVTFASATGIPTFATGAVFTGGVSGVTTLAASGVASVGRTLSVNRAIDSWSGSYSVVQVGANAAMWSGNSGSSDSYLTSGTYYNGTNYIATTTAAAQRINLGAAKILFGFAPGVALAGDTQTFTDVLSLSATGANLSATTTSTNSTTGSLLIGNGSAATNVGIGGGNIFAGGTINSGGNIVATGTISAPLNTGSERFGAGASITAADYSVAVGNSASIATGNHYSVAVGRAATVTAGNVVLVGANSSADGQYGVGIGYAVTSHGTGISIGGFSAASDGSIAIGYQRSTLVNGDISMGMGNGAHEVYLGAGKAAAAGYTTRINGTGNNAASGTGGILYLAGGKGVDGAGVGGSVVIQTARSGASATLVDSLTVSAAGNTTLAGNLTVSGTGTSSFASNVSIVGTNGFLTIDRTGASGPAIIWNNTGSGWGVTRVTASGTYSQRNAGDVEMFGTTSGTISTGAFSVGFTTSGTSTTAAAVLAKSLGLTENFYGYFASIGSTNSGSQVFSLDTASATGSAMSFKNSGTIYAYFGAGKYAISNSFSQASIALTTSGATNLYLGTNGTAGFTMDGTTQAVTLASNLTVSGTGDTTIAGALKVNAASGGATAYVQANEVTSAPSAVFRLWAPNASGSTSRNWQIGINQSVAGDFVLSRSTTTGGTSSTAVLSFNSSSDANFASTTSGTSTTAAAVLAKSLGLTENLYVGGTANITGTLRGSTGLTLQGGSTGPTTVYQTGTSGGITNTMGASGIFYVDQAADGTVMRSRGSAVGYEVGLTSSLGYVGTYSAHPFVIEAGGVTALTVTNTSLNAAFASTTEATTVSLASLTSSGGASITKSLIVGKGLGLGVTNTVTSGGTLTLASGSTFIQALTGSAAHTVQLPAANLMGAGIAVSFTIKSRSSGTVTVLPAGTDSIDGNTSYALPGSSNNSLTISSDGVSTWYIV